MEFLGVGPGELAFIVVIALILLGPKDMIAAGRTLGKTLRKIVTSPTWKALRTTGQELQKLPTRLMREAGLDEIKDLDKELRDAARISIDPRLVSRSLTGEGSLGTPGIQPGGDPGTASEPSAPEAGEPESSYEDPQD